MRAHLSGDQASPPNKAVDPTVRAASLRSAARPAAEAPIVRRAEPKHGAGRLPQSAVRQLMQGRAGGDTLHCMTRSQEKAEQAEQADELTDDEEAELMDRLREAEEHPERLISNDEVVRSRKKLAG